MKTFFKKYLWLWEFIGVAFILAVGLVAKLVPSILVLIVGIALIVFGIFRIIPLVRTTNEKFLNWIYTIEILVTIIAGVVLIILYVNETDLESAFGYLIGGVLYLRAIIFFYATTLRDEEADWPQFLTHAILITLGTAIIARGGFDTNDFGWLILAFAIITTGFIGYSGFNNYRNYRNQRAAEQITKKIKEEDIAPTADEIIEPTIEDEKIDDVDSEIPSENKDEVNL